MRTITVKTPNWFWKAFLWLDAKVCGVNKIVGFTTYWGTIIIREDRINDLRLLAHELTHVQQIENLGIFNFTYQYIRESMKTGYRNNKFEIEARAGAKNYMSILPKYKIVYK